MLTLDPWPIDCTETSVRNYHYSLRDNAVEHSSYLLHGGSLQSSQSILVSMFYLLAHLSVCQEAGPVSNSVFKRQNAKPRHIPGSFASCISTCCQSQWPRGLWRWSTPARLLRLLVRIPPEAWMPVFCVVCGQLVFSASDSSLAHSSPTECCVSECDMPRQWEGPSPLEAVATF
jgi:hypothetical protein